MDLIISIDNFMDGSNYREVNSPRTLEACLRSGLDPSELAPKPRGAFVTKELTKTMVDAKFQLYEKKRQDKISTVTQERQSLFKFAMRKSASQPGSPDPNHTGLLANNPKGGGSNLIEMEEKRMEALRARQEKELSKIVEREQALVELQKKIKRAEAEEVRKRKLHEKAVAEQKAEEEKKRKVREADLKRLEQEELEKKKVMAKKEAEFAEKRRILALKEERRIKSEAIRKDRERTEKMEEYRRKTEELIQQQAELAEQNRLTMLDRERRVKEQMERKKEQKAIEVQEAKDAASKRIEEALHKHHELHEQKKREFYERQAKALQLAKENAVVERQKIRAMADERDKKNKLRLGRLVEAYRHRAEHRKEIVDRRMSKDNCYDKIAEARAEHVAMMKFMADLKLQDKRDNVERTARVNEFNRLQTLKRIEDADKRYDNMLDQKKDLMKRYRQEEKKSLTRKHAIADAMDQMRVTGDFSLLDKIFGGSTGGAKSTGAAASAKMGGTHDGGDGGEGEGPDKMAATA